MAASQAEPPVQGQEDVIGYLPHYAIPSIASVLPAYTNAEQDEIHRTFHTGNYDFLKNLPDDIRYQQVIAARTARMEAVRQFLPGVTGAFPKAKPVNQQGLFQGFDYIPSPFNLEEELDSKTRVESEVKRMAIGGKEFIPAGTNNLFKHEVMDGQLFPYLGGAYDAEDVAELQYKLLERAKLPAIPFVPSGDSKMTDKPTRAVAWEMMNALRKWIQQDWEEAGVSIFENHQDCWVLRIELANSASPAPNGMEPLDGLLAYMNVFVRCNELVNAYSMVKVPEFWHTTPEGGGVYYVLRPPWVSAPALQTFYTLHPEERHWTTSFAVQELGKTRPLRDLTDQEEGALIAPHPSDGPSVLRYDSRLDWGVNFMTGTPASASLGKVIR
mmetsp:Transcript_22296/g.38132  ORF Transcript_22296/g.38132 Transcript_22296/m.38132 type:complete len:384 (+) Transcript_22296:193-1344(+)|eukprot:CAMPEP_0119114378 /NCGR_PEP_ID=MMETSP1180-20130426/47308_1 /TAXON_ID=3052 ORGANISM="Chlamydomonas cf sp, Strain CCMP681" /NCGR_SAMPLE_ID=MMETSP1180 /ASSEMBLY_ACC=CAM_ASM_000741 /LENGTH=383 /DNA_ID=CAMNT_0007102891 /DNA_START=107 /DNA_END=1258 /DNA_ORIENTATION=+